MEEFVFERLQVWQKGRTLVKEVYSLLDNFPNFPLKKSRLPKFSVKAKS